MAIIIEAPTEYQEESRSLFLAGGITHCPDWQADAIQRLEQSPLVLLNPRRCSFSLSDPNIGVEQIAWEHRHLRRATAILFWFPHETLCPIALYELGAWSMTSKPLFVGVHADYPRRLDVIEQTRLARPEVCVADSLDAVTAQIRRWYQ
jgi:hypothetical protein